MSSIASVPYKNLAVPASAGPQGCKYSSRSGPRFRGDNAPIVTVRPDWQRGADVGRSRNLGVASTSPFFEESNEVPDAACEAISATSLRSRTAVLQCIASRGVAAFDRANILG